MEEDTGKLLHAGGAGRIHGATHSLVDYNRAGIPLIEVVTKPILGTGELAPEIAKAYVSELRDLMRALGVSDVRMEEGSLRCDVNVSLNRQGEGWGTRTETKNVNSLRSVERAVRTEMVRQAEQLRLGERIILETRHFNEETGDTTSGRSKEEAEDYRYFSEPDLVPVAPSESWIEQLRGTLPEIPSVRRARLQNDWGISEFDMQSLVNAGALELIIASIDAGVQPSAARKWWTGELTRVANERDCELEELTVTPADIAQIEGLISEGVLTDKMARSVFEGLLDGEGNVTEVIDSRGLVVVKDEDVLVEAINQALSESPDIAEKIKSGKVAAAGAIVGAVMKSTKGQADAAKVRTLLLEQLGVKE
jgi:aspartyl-tRNA(Asn)/glutamyl-tRNA(Gln) amidotransferase subunit B